MYNLLVVDDEEIAIRGIVHGIDWNSLPIGNVFTAYDAAEARQLFRDHPIHVMISDIDMPNETGIDLLGWVNEHSPNTETIFLTGHADFRYAQQAIQLSSFDYLLKPIDHAMLKVCVEKALAGIREREQEESFRKTYEYYYEQWNRQLPLLVERFWQDVLNLRIAATAEQLEPLLAMYGIDLTIEKPVLPVLISIEEWKQEWSARDEEIMTYALKNAASDILLRDQPGHIIQDVNGMLFALLYDPDEHVLRSMDERCGDYIRKCGELLYSVVSCYIGEPASPRHLRHRIESLSDMERSNVSRTGAVFRADDFKQPSAKPSFMPNLAEWGTLVESGKQDELAHRIDETFDMLMRDHPDHTFMINFYFGLVHAVFHVLYRKGISPADVYPRGEYKEGEQAARTLASMKGWAAAFTQKAIGFIGSRGKEDSHTIARVKQFIEANLHQDLNREAIAEHVYLNPAYLSRLFRKETGLSLTDYMVEQRLKQAKAELENTNIKISDIAVSVGYSNFSHFSKLFKKLTGLTPQEYRKKYQDLL